MDLATLVLEARKKFLFGAPDWPYLKRQYPAYSLFQDLRHEYAKQFTTLEANTLLLQMPIETWNKDSFWDIQGETWRNNYYQRTTVHEEVCWCLANAVAYSIAPAWSLAPGTTWDAWCRMYPEKGWLECKPLKWFSK